MNNKYGIEKGQIYDRADGTKNHWLTVVDFDPNTDEVFVTEPDGNLRTIDAFKLTQVRYYLRT